MKKLLYLFLFVGLALTSCNKPDALPLEQDVIFKASELTTGFKAGDICDNDVAHYAIIEIQKLSEPTTSVEKIVDIFYLNGIMYTNTLKLDPGVYELTSFMLMNNGDDNMSQTSDDQMVYAAPEGGSTYANLVEGLPIEFTVGAFMKNEVNLEVLCFEPAIFDLFGFSWFAVDVNTVPNNDQFFFGDICTKYFEDYEANEFYDDQMVGGSLNHDMIAIFKIEVRKLNGSVWDIVGTYTNEATSMSGEPLIVPNPDNPNITGEQFKYKLFILVKDGAGFSYKKFKVWIVIDGTKIPSGNDNVIDFVLGSCVPDADLVLAPYMNLPASVTMLVDYSPDRVAGTYMDITLSDFIDGYGFTVSDAGFEITEESIYGAFCGDLGATIDNGSYDVDVFSSLYPELIPATYNFNSTPVLNHINWLGNNLYLYPDYTWQELQNAFWLILDPDYNGIYAGDVNQNSIDMKDDAIASANDAYQPPVGGWAAVLFVGPINDNGTASFQLLFTLVDP